MIENFVKASTCKVDCGNELGTGFLVSESMVLTARHCVIASITDEIEIKLAFPEHPDSLVAKVVSVSEEYDLCLLSISKIVDITPMKFGDTMPTEGEEWYAYGFPIIKRAFGHRVSGNILQTLNEPKLKIDIDLEIKQDVTLTKYDGLSGAALICDDVCRGLIRLKVDKTIGAISAFTITEFLEQNSIQIKQSKSESNDLLIQRKEFQLAFEEKVKNADGKYIFLSGSNGIGKSSYCNNFQPLDSSLDMLGCYSLSSVKDELGASHRIQPTVLLDWLSTTISIKLSGKTSRKEDLSYPVLIEKTSKLLNEFGGYCLSQGRQGLIFIDGLNEASEISEEQFSLFIGLLPINLPEGVTIVLTAPNFENISSYLNGRVDTENKIELPSLKRNVVRHYCWKELKEERATTSIIKIVCDKAQGHPLYLRYLIEFVNNCSDLEDLNEFPEFSGAVGEYYEKLWLKLLQDQEAVNLLAILSRLRSSINIEELPKILSASERTVLIPTLSRVRHLLANSETTTIYHSSFAEFLIEKTNQLNQDVEERIAKFCIDNSDLKYCALNSVYHLLLSGHEGYLKAIKKCDQSWVDQCVTIGVKPDTLLFDIENVLTAVTECGSTVDIIRMLLLSHRVNFRYNTLFTQSASLIAEALIALGKPQEAIQHTIRFNTLIISPDETFRIVVFLLDKAYIKEAKELLTLLDESIEGVLTSQGHQLNDYITLCEYRIRSLLLLSLVNEAPDNYQAINFLMQALQIIRTNTEDLSYESFLQISAALQCIIPSFNLCTLERYLGLNGLKKSGVKAPENLLELLISTLKNSLDWFDSFQKTKKCKCLPEIFSDINEALVSALYINKQLPQQDIDMLIQVGAPVSLIENMNEDEPKPTQIKILNDDGVELEHQQIFQGACNWRIATFLSDSVDCPQFNGWGKSNWLNSLELILSALYWCEGTALRGKAENNENLLIIAIENIQSQVLLPLAFSLKERASWENSYSIPEQLVPIIYKKLSELYLDCFPEKSLSFLNYIGENFSSQLGIYSEGFRAALFSVINEFTSIEITSTVNDQVFEILNNWKNFIVDNLANRHELVPELLTLIPLFVKIDSNEIAEELYQKALNVSMGPNWYKEDQFGLMLSLISSTKSLDYDQKIIPKVAGLLDKASGEMTFQRFVRYEKAEFIGELVRHKKYAQAIGYFKKETCGTLPELLIEATKGEIDRIDYLTGMRYPGGALDEQDAIFKLVHNAIDADWRLRWALLEIYLFGDERYTDQFAKEFAGLVNSFGDDSEVILEMKNRVTLLISSELSYSQQNKFLSSFQNELDKIFHNNFSVLFEGLPTGKVNESHIRHSESKVDKGVEEVDEDILFMPGTFGRRSATKESSRLLSTAKSKIKRGNITEARNIAVSALQVLQDGGWSIWGNLSGEASKLMDIIQSNNLDADKVSQLYAPLLLDERYEPRWRLAEHLIDRCGSIINGEDITSLAHSVLEHIRLMVGDAKDEIDSFQFLESDETKDISLEISDLILWLVDHPKWFRKDRAANMLVWLLSKDHTYYKTLAPEAFSMREGHGPDVLCGIFDGMSLTKPLEVWELIEPNIDVTNILECRHISRLAILHRIVTRASTRGAESATNLLVKIDELLKSKGVIKGTSNENRSLPAWASCIKEVWDELYILNIVNDEFIKCFEEEMNNVCSPLNVETAWQLEEMVSQGFNVSKTQSLNRWEGSVRFALNIALFHSNNRNNFLILESILRVFNPSKLSLTSVSGKKSRSNKIIEVLSNECDPKSVINNTGSVLLNYHEMINREDLKSCLQIEITAVMTSSYSGYKATPPTDGSLFSSKVSPDTNASIPGNEISHRIDPDYVFLGIYTPAIPTKAFVKMINAQDCDFIRSNWKEGRSSNQNTLGEPNIEGCSLEIKREKLRLPNGFNLAWVFKVNGEVIGIQRGMGL
ncbi:AVAST type 1 anti-phage system protease Avs1b [Pseudoalteromonas sp. SMN1298-MNA-CIBAN-0114]|uniref:AVAST type 1 anti-phage system protease Avs1b n=1 Tax=Pseudoalteromonas sp. SMN1298-MNA-CIBAN-0114 TaxID=3140428 RepID=UPI00331A6BF4